MLDGAGNIPNRISKKTHCSSVVAGVGSNSNPHLSAKRDTVIATLSLSSLCHMYKLIWPVEPPKTKIFLTSGHRVTITITFYNKYVDIFCLFAQLGTLFYQDLRQ